MSTTPEPKEEPTIAPAPAPAQPEPPAGPVSAAAAPPAHATTPAPQPMSTAAAAIEIRKPDAEAKWQDHYDNERHNLYSGMLADALQYQGFNPIIFRQELANKGASMKQIIVCMTALAISGNNPNRLTDSAKVTNAGISRRAYDIIRDVGVSGRKTKDNATITLSRIGIAFLPMYWCLRNWLNSQNKIQDQFPGTISVTLQDPNMGAIAVLNNAEREYRAYESAFSDAVSQTRTKAQAKNPTDWLAVAVRGLTADIPSRIVLKAINEMGGTPTPDDFGWMWEILINNVLVGDQADIPALTTKRVIPKVAAEEKEESA